MDYAMDEDFDSDAMMEDVFDFIDEKHAKQTSNFMPLVNNDRTKLRSIHEFCNDTTCMLHI